MDYLRQEDESVKKYKIRLFDNKELYNLTSQQIADLINKESGDNFNESTYRKWYKAYSEGKTDTEKELVSGDKLLKEYEMKRVEFEKEKIRYSDQRSAYIKNVRTDARKDELFDIVEKTVKDVKTPLAYKQSEIIASDNDLMISLCDIHYGIEVDNHWNKYNSDILMDRLKKYLDKILSVQKLHKSENCYVSANGDLISGNIHVQIQVANKENVIQQIMGVSEVIAWFLNELSGNFKNVYFNVVAGNHSRLNTKDNSLKDERLDDLIPWYIKARLQAKNNITILDNNIDSTMSLVNIRGKTYLNAHGDYDFSKSMIGNITMMIDEKPYAICTGHLHHNSTNNIQGVKMIMAGSCMGVDDYCITKRIFGNPSQMICVCNETGVDCFYDFDLS